MSLISRIARRHAGILASCVVFVATHAQAQAPAAPSVTVGASIKRLEFQWNAVPDAGYYELWFRANTGAPDQRISEIPASSTRASTRVSAHLFNWEQARYRVTACNTSGCTSSPALAVTQQSRRATGYFKSSMPESGAQYGDSVAVSEDGETLAVAATFEDGAGAAYIYRLFEGRWVEEERLAPAPDVGPAGVQLSLSADGNVLALATHEIVNAQEGVVYLYRREAGVWRLEQRLLGSPREEFDYFGESPDLSENGTRLLVTYGFGNMEMYRYDGSVWRLRKKLPLGPGAGAPGALNGNGYVTARCTRPGGALAVEIIWINTVMVVESVELAPASANRTCGGVDVDLYGNFIAVGNLPSAPAEPWDPKVHVLRRIDRVYREIATLAPGSWQQTIGNRLSTFGQVVKLSRLGEFVAVTDFDDSGAGRDIKAPPLQPGTVATGAVYVFARSGNSITLRRVLKPHQVATPVFHFGTALSFGDRGRTLAVGHADEDSAASGIGGDRNDASMGDAGVAWLY